VAVARGRRPWVAALGGGGLEGRPWVEAAAWRGGYLVATAWSGGCQGAAALGGDGLERRRPWGGGGLEGRLPGAGSQEAAARGRRS
jgi:hypothetical protein